ncbi:Adenosyl-chloride synthase [Pirellulimonas nuda]|uniref:Adenosyl-chloride synthase n=1 Tax=Pirellulimonas nuda TaxID=2528009 RepID=A0A518DAZ9_9BACT|nr:SAM-dependent chlorinase/fluorinase [Pirellulimonas nuda]QDU88661.1 Adenosyl-chloride synthase [Pirellulimonas nuda]
MRPILTLTTDFGEGSRYVAAMKGVALSIAPDLTVVDISHCVPPQDIAAGARVLVEATPWFPAGTLHLAVIDPGVGSDRRIVYAEIGDQRYVCPDNGLLGLLAVEQKPRKLHTVSEAEYWLPDVSRTFHGRDIMAPVAARLCSGLAPERLGPAIDGLTPLAAARGIRVGQRIEGEVVELDSFGNLITNITAEMLTGVPRDLSVTVECDDHQTLGIYETYADQPPMTLIALVGSGGALELAIVEDSAAIMLGVKAGTPVVVRW